MARLLGIALVFTIISSPVLAQQKGEGTSASLVVVEKKFQEVDVTELFSDSRTFRLTMTVKKQSTPTSFRQIAKPLFIVDPTFVVRDGTAHLSIFGDMLLIPVPGGGASGCFSLDLPERTEKLRKSFQIFAPFPRQSAAKAQSISLRESNLR